MMAVYKELTEANALNYSVALMLTGDEERGGFHGARHLLEDEGYTSRLAHIPDGGKKINVIEIENKGFRNLHLRSYGEPAHGSRPWLGKNAIDQLMDALVEIRQLFAEPDPNIWQTTCTLSTIKGGDAVNAVPDHAEASLDIRFPGTVDDEALEKQIRAITDKYNIEVTHNGTGAALHIDVESPVVKRYEQAIAKFSDKPIEYYRSEAGSDARFFAQQGIPVIVHQADCGGLHTNDEWLSLSSLEMYMNILREYMLSLNDVFAK
jgi:succinyl-diaminopimelate desuccinylase